MKVEDFRAAISKVNDQQVNFTEQTLEAFSFAGKWYPLHATINEMRRSHRIKSTWDNVKCRSVLAEFLKDVVYRRKFFNRRTPVEFTFDEALQQNLEMAYLRQNHNH